MRYCGRKGSGFMAGSEAPKPGRKLPHCSQNSPLLHPTLRFRGPASAYDASRLRTRAIWALLWRGLAVTTHLGWFCTSCGACFWPVGGRRRSRQKNGSSRRPSQTQDLGPVSHQRKSPSLRITLTVSDGLGEFYGESESSAWRTLCFRSKAKVDFRGGVHVMPVDFPRQRDHQLRRAI